MAEPFASYKEEHPVIRDIPAPSKAKGLENIATAIGQVQQTGTEIAVDYNKEASHNNLLASHAQLDDLDVRTKESIIKNPSQSKRILEKATATATSIKDNTVLNKADRANFNYLTNSTLNKLKLYGVQKQVSFDDEMERFHFGQNFENNLQDYQRSLLLNDNHKTANILAQSMVATIEGKIARGVITASQGLSYLKEFHNANRNAELWMGANANGEATAAHAITYNRTLGDQQMDMASMPSDEATRLASQSHSEYLTADQIRGNLAHGLPVNPMSIMHLNSPETIASLAQFRDGVNIAYGEVHSNKSWQELKAEQARLNKEKYPSEIQKGKSAYYNEKINAIENGNGYYQLVTETPQGAQVVQQAHLQSEMIKNDKGMTDADKAIHLGTIQNQLMTNLNSIGIGMGVPDRYRHLMPKEEIDAIDSNLFGGGNPVSAIANLSQLSPTNRAMIANSMPNSRKAITTYMIGQGLNRMDKGFMNDLALANQDNLDLKPELIKDKKTNDQKTMAKLQGNTDFRNVMGLLTLYPPSGVDKTTLNGGMMETAVRYVNWRAHKANDLTMSHVSDYIDDFVKNTGRAFSVIKGNNYLIDKNAIDPRLSESQYQLLTSYGIDKIKEAKLKYMSSAQFDEEMSRNPVTIVSTPTGRLAAIDSFGASITDPDGHPIFDQPYDTGMLATAEHYEKEHGRAITRMLKSMGDVKTVKLTNVKEGETLAGNIRQVKEGERPFEQPTWSDLFDDETLNRWKSAEYKGLLTELQELRERRGVKFDVKAAARTIKEHPQASFAQMTGILPILKDIGENVTAAVE